MAITANMTTHDGIALTDAYVRVSEAYVKKINGEWTGDDDAGYTQADSTWKLIYDVIINVDASKRADRLEKNYRIKNRHVDHFKIDYDIETSTNPIDLAYADLKTNSQLSNIADV